MAEVLRTSSKHHESKSFESLFRPYVVLCSLVAAFSLFSCRLFPPAHFAQMPSIQCANSPAVVEDRGVLARGLVSSRPCSR